MATIVLNWTPAGGTNSTSQIVQRKTVGGTFINLATLSNSANTYTDTTALDNIVYLYQIVTMCSLGGPIDTVDVQVVKITCPTITPTVTGNSVSIALAALTGTSVNYQSISLSVGGSNVFTQSLTGQASQTVTVPSLSYSTTYTYIVTLSAGSSTKTCTGTFNVGAAPTCVAASGLTAVVA